jgi:hypothetical protein
VPYRDLPVNVEIDKSFNNCSETSLRLAHAYHIQRAQGLGPAFCCARGRTTALAYRSGRASAAHISSTAANTLHLCHVVSFELHDVSQFRAIRRNFDSN